MVCPGDEIASIYSLTPNMRKTLDSKPPATPLNSWGTSAPERRKVTTLAGQGLVRWLLAVWWPRGLGRQTCSLSWQEVIPADWMCSIYGWTQGFMSWALSV